MTILRLSKKKIILLFFVGVLLLTLFLSYICLENSVMEYYSKNWVSKSINESKSKGAFIKELKFSPNVVEKYGFKIRFNECWIEHQTKLEHSFFFFKEYKPTGSYRICFNLKEKLPENNRLLSYFFIDQNRKSFVRNVSSNDEVFSAFIEKDSIEKIKINFVKSFDEPEKNRITVTFN